MLLWADACGHYSLCALSITGYVINLTFLWYVDPIMFINGC